MRIRPLSISLACCTLGLASLAGAGDDHVRPFLLPLPNHAYLSSKEESS